VIVVENFNVCMPHSFDAPVRGVPAGILL